MCVSFLYAQLIADFYSSASYECEDPPLPTLPRNARMICARSRATFTFSVYYIMFKLIPGRSAQTARKCIMNDGAFVHFRFVRYSVFGCVVCARPMDPTFRCYIALCERVPLSLVSACSRLSCHRYRATLHIFTQPPRKMPPPANAARSA